MSSPVCEAGLNDRLMGPVPASYPMVFLLVTYDTKGRDRGTWVAQLVKCLTSAQVMILRSVSSSPASGSVLTAQTLEPASDSVSPSLSSLPPAHVLSLSQK